jgi:hypothetical protein
MNERLDGPLLKIKRARKHIGDLDVAIHTFCKSQPYVLRSEDNLEISQMAVYVDSVRPIPDEIGAIIGDAAHNLRSSLDHLMCQLVDLGGGTPDRRTLFPISNSAQHYASSVGQGKIAHIHVDAEKVLKSVQPYVSGDNTLWHIHELDRVDKHRLVLTVAMYTNAWGVDVIGQELMFPLGIIGRPLVSGYEVLRTRQGHKNVKLGVDIAFGQAEIVAGKSVLKTLNAMADLTGYVVSQFEPFLS